MEAEFDDCEWEDYVVILRKWDDFKLKDDDGDGDDVFDGVSSQSDEMCYEVGANRGFVDFSKGFRVLNPEDTLVRVLDDIAKVSSVLSLSKESTTVLLCSYGWKIDNLYDDWFKDEDQVRKNCGLLENQIQFCSGANNLVATYLSLCPKGPMRSCPAGCGRAVEILPGKTRGRIYDVTCDCTREFCWNCLDEAHSPVDCATLLSWKSSFEFQNSNWVLANCKACPACNRVVENTTAGKILICPPPCDFAFCWECLGPWSEHEGTPGGNFNYPCKGYAADAMNLLESDGIVKEREKARDSLEKYRYCYERWSTHDEWRQIALLDMQELKSVHLNALSEVQNRSVYNLKFIVDAYNQIIECRGILKWAYVYGFYCVPEDDHVKNNYFEFVLAQAETALERLHNCAQIELPIYLKVPLDDFDAFRMRLCKLTRVTRDYFDKFVCAVENCQLM